MKKFIVFAVVLALLVPAAAYAKAEFSLGGYIKLDTFWDSTQNSSLLHTPVQRTNDGAFHHGRFNMRAQESRFNFTIKGPKVFGAVLTGFIEMDFDGNPDNITVANGGGGIAGTWQARLRHAMFRLDWPETQLLMGQYWGMFSNWWTEGAEDGPFIPYGSALDRIPQIRLTQKFLGDWSVAGLVGLPQIAAGTDTTPYSDNANNGSAAETPQLQGQIKYEHDWWGKAAYYGHPVPFTVTVSGGWQRAINRFANNVNSAGGFALNAFGENGYRAAAPAGSIVTQQFVNPWMAQAAMFIPLIPTHTANLAGTASILTQWYIGQGVEAFGITGGASNIYRFAYQAFPNGPFVYNISLLKRFGGWVEGQYYFTNQWFANVAYGISRCYGVDRQNLTPLTQDAVSADQFRTMQQVDATLWYRPIQALKFGLQYTYATTNWFQRTDVPAGGNNLDNAGNEHRVEFVGYFFF
jgi:hypothetical protein